ncbi:hypothetical protein FGB62_1g697 [Gracilaria domingensis]|nr:hypothetical protein FGB62_1g697 [Gracilaria domingensis]
MTRRYVSIVKFQEYGTLSEERVTGKHGSVVRHHSFPDANVQYVDVDISEVFEGPLVSCVVELDRTFYTPCKLDHPFAAVPGICSSVFSTNVHLSV